MFGQSATTNTFGQPTAFGTSTSTPFGTMNPQPQQGSLFGQTSTPSLFGMSQPNSIFGASNTSQTNTFGSQPTSTFGNTSLFGNANRGFGMSSGTSFSNTLGSTMNVTGTTVKFVPQTGTDTMMKNGHSQSTSINIRLQCITCMREYESKSLEELRFEDYTANRKGGSQQSSSLFGTSSINPGGSSLFGGNAGSTNTFGASASTGNLFSQNKSTFGSIAPTTTSSSFFGSNSLNTNKSTSLFGQSATTNTFGQPNAFGTSTLAPFGAMNPQPQQNSLFGTTSTNNNTLFGNKSQPSSIFGAANSSQTNAFGSLAPTTSTTSIFGSSNVNANKPPALFGQNPTTNTFGSQPNAFGASTSTSFGTLNPQPQQGAPFGQTSANSLFSMNPTQSIFGAANNSFGSLAPTTTTANIFGSSFNTNRPTLLSQNPTTNTFGGQPNTFGSATQPQFGPFNPQPQQSTFTGQYSTPSLYSTNFDSDRIITRLQTLPYGSPQLLTDNTSSPRSIKTTFTTDLKTLNQYKISATSQTEAKVQRVPATGKPTSLLFDGLDDESTDNLKCAQDIFSPRPNIKKLVLNKGHTSLFKSSPSFIKSPPAKGTETSATFSNKENRSPEMNTSLMSKQTTLDNTIDVINKLASEAKQDANTSTGSSSAEKSFAFEQLNSTATAENFTPSSYIPKCGIILNRTDYYTIPSLEECDAYYDAENDNCIVESFTVGRVDYGSIYWKGPLNVKGINLDEIVHIRRKEVIVYPDDDAKPPLGEGLNRPAQITLDQVWPIDKTTREFIKDSARLRTMKYSEKVEAATIKLDAIFKEYRPDTGSWVFNVKHFSKYAFDADDDDVEMEQPTKTTSQSEAQKNDNSSAKTSFKVNGDSFGHLTSAPIELMPKGYQVMNGFGGSGGGAPLQTGTGREVPTLEAAARDASAHNLSNYYNYDSLFQEDELDAQTNETAANQPRAKDELHLMRSALFFEQDEEVDSAAKKCKNLSFTKSATSHQIIPSLFPSKFKSTLTKRRKLTFEAIPSKNVTNIYSMGGYSGSPKVNFVNGSNRFCIIFGGQVLIFEANFLDVPNETSDQKLQDHLVRNSTFLPASNAQFPPLIKSNKFVLNVGGEKRPDLNALIEALYGELSETLDYCKYQERIRRIENWLFNYNKDLPVPEKPFARILHFLTTNELEFAVTECINSKQPRLSLLIASGPFGNKSAIMAQLDHWKRSESDAFIEIGLLKLYVLLSGQSSWTLSTGQTVEVFEGLEWTQQLILLLLYKDFHVADSEVFGTNLVKLAIAELTVKPNSVEYHLLAQSEPWVAIAASPNLLDSWFLHESLTSFNVIAEDIYNCKSDSIHLHLASQIKDLRWAIFFALHIRNDFIRFHFVAELLVRNSTQLIDADVEKFLTEKLSVNERLISEAKLYYSKSCFDQDKTAYLF